MFPEPLSHLLAAVFSAFAAGLCAFIVVHHIRKPSLSPRKLEKFWTNVDLPDDRPKFSTKQVVVLAVTCYVMMFPAIMGITGSWPTGLVVQINAGAVVVGGAMRVLSHGRDDGWKFVDLIGKLIAYFGAFVSIYVFAMQPQ